MDDAALMRLIERKEERDQARDQPVSGEGAGSLEDVAKRLTLEELRDDVKRPLFALSIVKNSKCIWVLKRSGDLSFAEETLGQHLIR